MDSCFPVFLHLSVSHRNLLVTPIPYPISAKKSSPLFTISSAVIVASGSAVGITVTVVVPVATAAIVAAAVIPASVPCASSASIPSAAITAAPVVSPVSVPVVPTAVTTIAVIVAAIISTITHMINLLINRFVLYHMGHPENCAYLLCLLFFSHPAHLRSSPEFCSSRLRS